jgi:hypothetical protein
MESLRIGFLDFNGTLSFNFERVTPATSICPAALVASSYAAWLPGRSIPLFENDRAVSFTIILSMQLFRVPFMSI